MADDAPGTGERPEAAIRTMKSDVSEFLRTTKPSLVSLLARQAQLEEYRLPGVLPPARSRLTRMLAIGASIALGAAGLAIYFYSGSSPVPGPDASQEFRPPSFIFAEEEVTAIIGRTRGQLLTALGALNRAPPPSGTFRRIVIRLRNGAEGAGTHLGARELFTLAGASFASALADTITAPPQIFLHGRGASARLAIIIEVRNPALALQILHDAEPSLPRDLEAAFLGTPPPPSFAPYRDIAYRNINFRYLALDAITERGVGYLYFPAARRIVMATSEETLRAVIDRLLERR